MKDFKAMLEAEIEREDLGAETKSKIGGKLKHSDKKNKGKVKKTDPADEGIPREDI